jgi:hypothetical protein
MITQSPCLAGHARDGQGASAGQRPLGCGNGEGAPAGSGDRRRGERLAGRLYMMPLLVPERQAWYIDATDRLKLIKYYHIDTLHPVSP